MIETAILTAWPAIERGGPWVALALVGFLFITGRMVTKSAHDRTIEILSAGHTERMADLRAQLAVKDETIATLLRQKDDLLAGARVSARALEAIRAQSEIGGGDGMAA